MRITINSDTTFIMSDDLGNILDGTELGLYHEDSRFLSTYELTLDGQLPLLLAARPTAPYAAAHFLTNPILPAVPRGQLSLIRRRQVGDGMREELEELSFRTVNPEAYATISLRLSVLRPRNRALVRSQPWDLHDGQRVAASECRQAQARPSRKQRRR